MPNNDDLARQIIESLRDTRNAFDSLRDEIRRVEASTAQQIAEVRQDVQRLSETRISVAGIEERLKSLDESTKDRFKVLHHRLDDIEKKSTEAWTRWIALGALVVAIAQAAFQFFGK
ncbi:MAG: hypothetical protein K1Y36_10430 [Blastocatellia bacterium]|nr:hypothetical protein [Blastocatellia bacterium]